MSQYRRLLLIIDPGLRHSFAINHAAALARASGASLHIAALTASLKLFSLLDEVDRKKARESYLQGHRDWLNDHTKNLRGRGVEVTSEVAWADDMQQDILDHVAEMQPDLLIKEVQHVSAFKRAFFTPLDWRLLRQCPVPMYLIGEKSHTLPRKVVAAVDLSDLEPERCQLNARIVGQAYGLALQCKAELHLLHACDISAFYAPNAESVALTDLVDEVRSSEEASFRKFANRHGVPADRRHFVIGHPVMALSEFVSEHHVDVIVMGKIQDRRLDKLLGSTTEHILYQIPCSVLAV